jgi:hypothetical protein
LDGFHNGRFNVKSSNPNHDADWSITISMTRYGDVEKPPQGTIRRWANEHPMLLGLISAAIFGLFAIGSPFVVRLFKAMGW